MRKSVIWLLTSGCLTGCIAYPRFVYVYQSPQYTGLFVDRQHRPVPGVWVSTGRGQGAQTGPDGLVEVPPRRTFQVVRFVFIGDPSPLAFQKTIRASWSGERSGVQGWLQHEHQVRFYSSQRQPTVIRDTVVLPIP